MTDDFLEFCKRNNLNASADDPQWQAITSDRNTVISAGAGTGKTTVLSFRFLRIVAEKKAKPSEILTITFTRKATSEMKERIYSLLQQAHKEGFVTDEDIENYSESVISTVDSFCSDIVRKNSIHQGISRDFGILSETQEKNLTDSIAEKLIVENNDFSQHFLKYLSIENIKKICNSLSSDFLTITTDFNPIKTREQLACFIEQTLNNTALETVRKIEESLEDLNIKQERKDAYSRIITLLQNPSYQQLDLVRENLKCLDRPKEDKELRNSIKEDIENVYIPMLTARENLPMADLFYNFIKDFHRELCREKRSRGLLSFNDVMKLSLKILTEDKDQRQYYKNAFKYIMIDEFQDNNDDYRKLLFLLSEKNENFNTSIPKAEELEKNKIFLVGDQKQSIYRFRGADVSVFKELSQSIGTKPIELSRNWRSEPYIINFCNDVFSKVMNNEDKLEYEADFSALEVKPKASVDGKITIIRSSEENNSRAEACAVADYIKEICSQDSTCLVPDDSTKKPRPPRYGEIGILLRSTTNQGILESALNQRRIPFSVTMPKTLMKEAITNDFWTAIMHVLYPFDNVILASFLKSPFCAVKDSELLSALAEYSKEEPQNPKIKAAKDTIEGLKNKLSDEGLSSAISYLWNNCGYRSFIISAKEDRSYTQHFDWLYSIAVDFENQGKSIVEFADYIRAFQEGNLTKPDEQTVFDERLDGVQIMTVHKSKGLAFKVVIVYGTDQGSSSGFFYPNNTTDNGFLSVRFMPYKNSQKKDVAENPIALLYKNREKKMENAETKRVFYVAATRPKYHLVFSVSNPVIKGEESQHSLWGYLTSGLEIDTQIPDKIYNRDGYCLQVRTIEYNEESCAVERKTPHVKTEAFTTQKCLEKCAITEQEENVKGGEKLPVIESDSIIDSYDFSAGFGTLVHSLIEESLTGNESEKKFPEKISQKEKETLLKDARLLADNFLNSTYIKTLLDEGAKLYPEKPLLLYIPEQNLVEEGRIDLLCVTAKTVTIIDFKTDRYRQEEKHRLQLNSYKLAIEKMPEFKGKDIVTNVVYLRDKMK